MHQTHSQYLVIMARGKPISEDFRVAIIRQHNISLSRSSVRNIISLYKKTHDIAVKRKVGRPKLATAANLRVLKRIVESHRRESMQKVACLWSEATSKTFSKWTCRRAIGKLGYKFYKVFFS